MFRKNLKPLLLLLIIFSYSLQAQDQQAVVTYKGEIQKTYQDSFVNAFKKRKDVPMHRKQSLAERYYSATPEFFVLNIKNNESYYYEDEALDPVKGYNIGSLAPIYDLYTTTEKDFIVEFTSTFGKVRRIPLNWDLSSGETREIGGYTCFKATAVERLYSRQGFYYNRDVVAWFTPEIPLHFGPSHYTGLPGLVIQVIRDKFTLTATEITLNPEDEVKITTVSEDDKMITEEEMHRRIGGIMEEYKSGN